MTIEALKKRIKVTEDLREIVSTMKAMSSASIAQYEKANGALSKYRLNLRDAFHALARQNPVPKVNTQSSGKCLLILIGSDNGMVGKFNKEILQKAKEHLRKNGISPRDVMFLTVGKRMSAVVAQEKLKIYAKYAISNSVKMVNTIAETVIMKLDEATTTDDVTAVSVFYHKRSSGEQIKVARQNIIPFDFASYLRLKNEPWETNNVPLIPVKPKDMFVALMNEYLMISMASFLNYSLSAEHYTRMTNMQNAEKNIDENLEELNLAYQQQRQESITDELIDVISGAEAMS